MSVEIERKLNQRVDEATQKLEARIDALESLVANLTMAYTEAHAAIENIVEEMMAPRSEEEREQFRKDKDKKHAELIATMQEVIGGMETGSQGASGNAVLNMAARKHAD